MISLEKMLCKKVTLYGLEQSTIDEILKQAGKRGLSQDDLSILNACITRLQTTSLSEDQYKLFKKFLINKLEIELI